MLARAVATECNVPFISLNSSILESKWWGESPKLLSAAFKLARKRLAPCIIFFDEIDGIGRTRTESDQSCVYSFKCELLRNLDGVDTQKELPVMVIACTNCIDSLDPALRRRFARVIKIEKPNEKERLDILSKLTLHEKHKQKDILKKVAIASEGLSGADLASLFNEASISRMRSTNLEQEIENGNVKNNKDLIDKMGGLTWEHWKCTGILKSELIYSVEKTGTV